MKHIFVLILLSVFLIIYFDNHLFIFGQDQSFNENPSKIILTDSNLQAEIITSGLDFPTSMAFLGSTDFIVLEKNTGMVKRVIDGNIISEPLLQIDVSKKDERGLLGVAVSEIKQNNKEDENNTNDNDITHNVFLSYVSCESKGSNCENKVTKYQLDNKNNELVNPQILLSIPSFPDPAHVGGIITIGPDNNLYVTVGDFHNTVPKELYKTQAQNFEDGELPDGRAGILRITQDGEPVGKEGILGNEYPLNLYYAYGIRNSFGLDFDPLTGLLWDTENGPKYGDEINLVEPGFNSGSTKIFGIWEVDKEGNKQEENQKKDKDDRNSYQIQIDENNDKNPKNLFYFDGRGHYSSPEFIWDKPYAPTALVFLNSTKYGTEYENDMFVATADAGRLLHFDLSEDRRELILTGDLSDKIAKDKSEFSSIEFGRGFNLITDLKVNPFDGYLYGVAPFGQSESSKSKEPGRGIVYKIIPKNSTSKPVTYSTQDIMMDKKLFYIHTCNQKNDNKLLTYTYEPFLSVNGTDYIDISHNKTLSLEEFTIFLWFKTDQFDFSEPAHLVNKGGMNSDEKGENMNYGVWISEGGEIHGGFESKPGEDFIVQSNKKYNDGKWHFVLLSYDGDLLRLDIDGKEIDRQNTEKVIPDTTGDQPLRIGANALDKDKFFTGNIDEIRIYNKGLTEKEIQEIYKENTFESEDSQILHLNFEVNNKKDKQESIEKKVKVTANTKKQILNRTLSDFNTTNITTVKPESSEKDLFSSKNNYNMMNEQIKEKQLEKELKELLQSNQPLSPSPIINDDQVDDNNNTYANTTKLHPIETNENNIKNELLSPSISSLLENNKTEENDTIEIYDDVFNVVTAGDFGCSMRAQENIKNMESLDPELFLVLGDLSYKKTPKCWVNMTESFDTNIKIAIGNHEHWEESKGSEELTQSYLDLYDLDNSYYSFDYKNLHVLVLDTQKELSIDLLEGNAISEDNKYYDKYLEIIEENGDTTELFKEMLKKDKKSKNKKGDNKEQLITYLKPEITVDALIKKQSINTNIEELNRKLSNNSIVPEIIVDPKQYEFVVADLKKASKDPSIDWIFVMMHKPMYSTNSKQSSEFIIREKYQPIFDEYGVDLVLQAHNHFYDRTLPIKYNPENITKPMIFDNTNDDDDDDFIDPDGTIFTVVGTGGKSPHRLVNTHEYTASQHLPIAGFLNIEIAGKQLEATYYDIGIKCEESVSEKTGRTIFNLDKCEPRDESDPLEITDKYTIVKES